MVLLQGLFKINRGVRLLFSKDTVEGHRELCVFSLKRLGFLRNGYSGLLSWTSCQTGEVKGSIQVRREDNMLHLTYRSRSYGQDWEDVKETIYLAETRPNYGGSRLWFHCPSCWSRRAKLYGGKYFRCRECRDLCYETQLESESSRIMSAMYKIRHRLGDYNGLDEWFPSKPKGMRWKTYEALEERYEALDRGLGIAFVQRFGGCSNLF